MKCIMCDVKAASRHIQKQTIYKLSHTTHLLVLNHIFYFICVVVAPACACRAYWPFQKPQASDSCAAGVQHLGTQSSIINRLGGDLLRIWRHVCAAWGFGTSSLAITYQVCRLSDCRHHCLLRAAVTMDRVVRAVVLHRTLEVCWHHSDRYGRVIRVADSRHVHGARRMQSRQHPVLLHLTAATCCIWTQWVLDVNLLLDDALLDKILIHRIA